ncbi:MAG: hypothetical protein U1G08_22055, partial [Verrucomicrobiota bacterium]
MLDPWILAFSLVTVAATIWMGFRSARSSKSAADFFVAGRSVSVGWNASAISGEYLSAASFMGVAGMVMSSGYDALWYPVCYACGYLFLLLFIAGPLRRFGAYTIPDFAEGRYDSPVFRKIAVLFVLFIGFFYTMPQMKGAGTTLAYVFKDIEFFGQKGLPYWVGVVVVGAVITLNVALGGMKGITLVQAFQYWMKMFAISVPIFVLASVYGGYGKQLGLEQAGVSGPGAIRTWTAPPVLPAAETPLLMEGQKPLEVGLSYGASPPKIEPTTTLRPIRQVSLPPLWGKVTMTFSRKGGFKDWLDKVSRAFRARGSTFTPPPTGIPLETVAGAIYPMFLLPPPSTFSIYFSPGLSAESVLIRPITNRPAATLKKGPQGFRELLEANGYTLVHLRHDTVKIYPTFEAARYAKETPDAVQEGVGGGSVVYSDSERRQTPTHTREEEGIARRRVPEKAPKDPVWLNPFGPLTTKAARAALATTATDAELIAKSPEMTRPMQVLGTILYPSNVAGLVARIQHAFRKLPPTHWRTMIGGGSSNVMAHLPAPLSVYAAAVGKTVIWDTNLAAMGPFLMNVSHTDATTDSEFAATISRQLADQGIALVESTRGTVYAVNAEQLRILRSAQPAPNEASLR